MISVAATGVCSGGSTIWYTVGMFMLIFKIVIPIILIILGMIDLGKAVISSDEKAVSKSAKSLLNRVIAAVAIFFIPTIVGLVFNLVGTFSSSGAKQEFEICAACVSDPNGGRCSACVENADSSACLTGN